MGIYSNPAQKLTILVTFQWGETPTVSRYCRQTKPIVYGGNTYSACPTIDAEFANGIQGGPVDDPLTLVAPYSISPVDKLIRAYPHSRVYVTVDEIDPRFLDGSTTRRIMNGFVTKTSKNKAGFKGLAKLEVSGAKTLIQFPVGILATDQCPWTFRDTNCCADVDDQTGTITGISANQLTVSGLSTPRADYWFNGYALIDGLRISIRAHNSGGTVFQMKDLIPPEWNGLTVTFAPGCQGFIQHCREWNNEKRFGGVGISMLAYNPLYEQPAQ